MSQDNQQGSPDNNYWRSFEEYYNDPESAELRNHEFVPGAAEDMNIEDMNHLTRRHFLALLGTSAALAGTGCSNYYDQGEIVPYTKKPIDTLPGNANFFASTLVDGQEAHGVLIKTREGRPIKIDGNEDHPISGGKVNQRIQASLMGLYDPERFRFPIDVKKVKDWSIWRDEANKGRKEFDSTVHADWAIIDAAVKAELAAGSKIAIVANSVLSPSQQELLKGYEDSGAKVLSYELSSSQVRDQAWALCHGGKKAPLIDWEKPDVLVSLESDFLGSDGQATEATLAYSKRRSARFKSSTSFNKLYVIESQTSLTGLNADYRARLNPLKQQSFVLNLLSAIKDVYTIDAAVLELAKKSDVSVVVPEGLIKDVKAGKGKVLFVAGEKLPLSVHILVNYLNEVVEAQSCYKKSDAQELRPLANAGEIKTFVEEVAAGKFGIVIHLGSNPVYHWQSSLNYSSALSKAKLVLTFSDSLNETVAVSHYALATHHPLESWGDYYTRSNCYSLQQPVVNPIHQDTRQAEGVLLSWAANVPYSEAIWREMIKKFAKDVIYKSVGSASDFLSFWKSGLHDGFIKINMPQKEKKVFDIEALKSVVEAEAISDFTVILTNSSRMGDGRYIDNGWLHELPHPVSKVVWDNYASVSRKTADDLKVRPYINPYDKNYDTITLTKNGRSLVVPVLMQPGMEDGVIAIELGYGRDVCGTIGEGESSEKKVGFNAIKLMGDDGVSPWLYTGFKATKASGSYKLVSTQEHHSLTGEPNGEATVGDLLKSLKIIDGGKFLAEEIRHIEEKRHIIQEADIKTRKFYHVPHHEIFSINDLHDYPGYKWAMAIDLNKCTGCNDCIVSCNAENNIPVVGKTQVEKGREMHWLRIDRYYKGTPESVQASFQPMLCQHCDNAPCENVCPVVATQHSPDGLNDMAYNRCVGTRYCANNCPYKVRRFNYYNFRNNLGRKSMTGYGHYEKKPSDLIHNPEVSVRSRGVMEKCSFCVQKIFEAKQKAKEKGRTIIDGEVKTACQSACSAEAIVFGNINDPKSAVRQWSNNDLNYKVLDALNVRPNVNYLAKLRYENLSTWGHEKHESKSNGHEGHDEKAKTEPH